MYECFKIDDLNRMFDEFVNIINDRYEPMKESELDSLQYYAIFKKYEKNEIILCEESLSQNIFFVLEGSLRVYYNINGSDKTTFFHSKGEFVWRSCNNGTFHIPMQENYQALEKTTLVHFDKNKIEEMFKYLPKLERIARLGAENGLMEYQQLNASHILLSAEERYVELLEINKEIFQRAPQKYIASYLGISPETLSRIKRRVYTK